MNIYYNNDYVASLYAFDTTRKSEHIAMSLETNPIAGVELKDPSGDFGTAIDLICSVHSQSYVDAVWSGQPNTLAESNGFDWDNGIFKMAVSHSAGLIAATREALENKTVSGSLSSGLHHARVGEGGGFCTFNGLTVANAYAKTMGAERVLMLDYDAHGGGGTWNILMNKADSLAQTSHIDVTVSPFDTYAPKGDSRLDVVHPEEYSKAIMDSLGYAASLGSFDLIIYNAGMDPLNSGVSIKSIEAREDAVREFIGDTPAIFALAGGYRWGGATMEDVVSWHRMTLRAWSE